MKSGQRLIYCFLAVMALPFFVYAGEFRIFPSKQEMVISPGERVEKRIKVDNHTGAEAHFVVMAEDLTVSAGPTGESEVVLGGISLDPRLSFKNIVSFLPAEFTLADGDSQEINVVVDLPGNFSPGGLTGVVLVGKKNKNDLAEARLTTRLGSIFLIRVTGQTKEAGELTAFKLTDRLALGYDTTNFIVSYRNKGNVYLNPFGVIEIKNILGFKQTIPIEPWYVLADSTKSQTITWSPGWRFGPYRATIFLNRGYDKIVDSQEISFWLLPWPVILFFVVVFGFGWSSYFKRRRRIYAE